MPPDLTLDTCVMTADPTPGTTIYFPVMVHKIHFARLLGGYAEENNLINPGKLTIIGFQNTAIDLSEILFPQDIRNCTKCHADSGATCSSTVPCMGVGQQCKGGKCVNRAWTEPSKEICTSCHDEDHVVGHAEIMTWSSPTGPIETCHACHGEGADFAVEKVHNISNPYVPPYPREPEGM